MKKVLILSNDNKTICYFRHEFLQRLIDENYDVIISLPKHERNTAFEKIRCKVDEIKEAAASGRPVIASNVPGCKEIFDERVSGYGFEVKKSFICINHRQERVYCGKAV